MVTEQDLSYLWKGFKTPPADVQEMSAVRKRFQRRRRRRILVMNLSFLVTIALSVWIWINFQPRLITTRAGLILMFAAMLYYLYHSNRMLPRYNKLGAMDALHYTRALIRIAVDERKLLQQKFILYSLVLGGGLLLYLTEFLLQMPLLWAWITGLLSLGWMLFGWFYLRPRRVKKLQQEIDGHLSHFDNLHHQFRH